MITISFFDFNDFKWYDYLMCIFSLIPFYFQSNYPLRSYFNVAVLFFQYLKNGSSIFSKIFCSILEYISSPIKDSENINVIGIFEEQQISFSKILVCILFYFISFFTSNSMLYIALLNLAICIVDSGL